MTKSREQGNCKRRAFAEVWGVPTQLIKVRDAQRRAENKGIAKGVPLPEHEEIPTQLI